VSDAPQKSHLSGDSNSLDRSGEEKVFPTIGPGPNSSGASAEVRVIVASFVGWSGFSLGLLNVYPTLFSWQSASDKLLGAIIDSA